MELAEIRERLDRFFRAHGAGERAHVTDLEPGPGHAGFSYLFTVSGAAGEARYFMRLPPPNVKWEGTADVLRQATVLKALDGTGVPHATVLWSGDALVWFGCPYLIQERVDGQSLTAATIDRIEAGQLEQVAEQAMRALAGIHRLDPASCAYLGDFWGFEFDVTRWDRFYERAADPELLALQPTVRQLLLDQIPHNARIGVYHGDFQWSNLMYTDDGRLTAVVDFELCGIGAVLNDVGWFCAFNDPTAWPEGRQGLPGMPGADALEAMYQDAWGEKTANIAWFTALAMYKFGIITGFNLMLHRRGKRHDPHWEDLKPGMKTNMEYAYRLLRS